MRGFFVLISIIVQCCAQNLIVELPKGKVRGTTINASSGRTFYAWRHIPYAKPPVGELRFKPPVEPDPWTGILDGSKDSKACIRFGTLPGYPTPTAGYDEDCLCVNVYSPVPPNSSLNLPVMFWIYGGGFMIGHSDFTFYDPSPILAEYVIVVSFNYRLGLFGFLSTEDEVLSGNGGLKDQVLAMQWTKKNIAYFGGNSSDITLFGESSGAWSVGYHLVSPKAKGLFVAGIFESGTSLFVPPQTDARKSALTLAKEVNSSIVESSSSEDILTTLQTADANLLVNISMTLDIRPRVTFEPESDSAYLTKKQIFYESYESGHFSQVPIIIGLNSAETIGSISDVPTGKQLAARYDSNYTLLMPNMHLKDGVSEEIVAREIKHAYVGNGSFVDNLGALVNFLTDNTVSRPSTKQAFLQSKYIPVYFYQFSFVGGVSINHPVLPGCGRVGHTEELQYLFNISAKPIKTETEFLTRSRLVKLWANFAKAKNPTPGDDSAELLQHVTWEKFDDKTLKYLDIGDNLELKSKFKGVLPDFWTHLWKTYSYRPYITF